MKKSPPLHLFLFSLLFFIHFQLLTALIEATYTFGLLSVDIPPEIVYVLFLLSPILLILFTRLLSIEASRPFALVTALVALLSWGILYFLDTRGRMLASGVGVGAMLLFFPSLIARKPPQSNTVSLGGSLAFGILVGVALRQFEFGSVPLPGALQVIFTAVVLILVAAALVVWYLQPPPQPRIPAVAPFSLFSTFLAFLGLSSVMLLLYFAFSNPGVIVRWTGTAYLGVVGLASAIVAVFLFFYFAPERSHFSVSPTTLIIWNGLFTLSLAGTLLPQQVAFPTDPAAYPLAEPATGTLASAALILMLLLHPVLYIDAALLFKRLASERVSPKRLAWAATFAALYQLALIFANVFTTVYDYVPVIGSYFRNQFTLVHLIPCAALFLAVLWHQEEVSFQPAAGYLRWPLIAASVLALLIIGMVAASSLQSVAQPREETLRVMTYNIQQGYSADGQKNFTGLLREIEHREPDIIGLQESDMARISGGNSDIVRYLAANLRMEAYYGPKTVTGTFGIALLSRYPILNPRTYYLYSSGEQTAIIVAEIQEGNQIYTVMVTHLGNGGPLIQQQQVLTLTDGKSNIILMGDFNFSPSSEQYRLTTASLEDGWLLAKQKVLTPAEQEIDNRIDHIFLSPGFDVLVGEYVGEGASDHPALFLEMRLLP